MLFKCMGDEVSVGVTGGVAADAVPALELPPPASPVDSRPPLGSLYEANNTDDTDLLADFPLRRSSFDVDDDAFELLQREMRALMEGP